MKKIKKYDDLVIAILFIIPITLVMLFTKVDVGDEIINFQSVMKMINGNLIYRDFNVIVTPLFFNIAYVILKVLGANLFSFRVYNILIFDFLFLIMYKILKSIKLEKNMALLGTIFTFIITMPYIQVGANYNTLALALFMLGIYFFINIKDIKKHTILQGILIYLIFMTKQNFGVYYMLALWSNEILTKKKKSILRIGTEIIIFISLLMITVIVMMLRGNLIQCIDYAFLGMQEFTTENFAIQKQVILLLAVGVIISILYSIQIWKKELKGASEKSILIFSLFLNLTIFPIINFYHTTYGILLCLVMGLKFIAPELEKNKKLIVSLNVLLFLIINIYGISCGLKLDKKEYIFEENGAYKFCYIENNLYEEIQNVRTYINEQDKKDVIVFSERAPLYMIGLNKNHGIFDLPFLGNLGKDGTKGMIKKIENLQNTQILVGKTFYWQIPMDAREYIITHFRKIGEIEQYYIYER